MSPGRRSSDTARDPPATTRRRSQQARNVPIISVQPTDDEFAATQAQWSDYARNFGLDPDQWLAAYNRGETLYSQKDPAPHREETKYRRDRREPQGARTRPRTSYRRTRSAVRETGGIDDAAAVPTYTRTADLEPTGHLRIPRDVEHRHAPQNDSGYEYREVEVCGESARSTFPAWQRRTQRSRTPHSPTDPRLQPDPTMPARPRSMDARPRTSSGAGTWARPEMDTQLDVKESRRARRVQSRLDRAAHRDAPYFDSPSGDDGGRTRRQPRPPTTYVVDDSGRHDLADSDHSDSPGRTPRKASHTTPRTAQEALFGSDGTYYYTIPTRREDRAYATRRGEPSASYDTTRDPSRPVYSGTYVPRYRSSSPRPRESSPFPQARHPATAWRSRSVNQRGPSQVDTDYAPNESGAYPSDEQQYPRNSPPRMEYLRSRRRSPQPHRAHATVQRSSRSRPTTRRASPDPAWNRHRSQDQRSSPEGRPPTTRRLSRSHEELPARRERATRARKGPADTVFFAVGMATLAGTAAFTVANAVNSIKDKGSEVLGFKRKTESRSMDTRSIVSDSYARLERRSMDSDPPSWSPRRTRPRFRTPSPSPKRTTPRRRVSPERPPRRGRKSDVVYKFYGVDSPPSSPHPSRARARSRSRSRNRRYWRALDATPPRRSLEFPTDAQPQTSTGSDEIVVDEDTPDPTAEGEGEGHGDSAKPRTTFEERYTPKWARSPADSSQALVPYDNKGEQGDVAGPSGESPAHGQPTTRSQSTQTGPELYAGSRETADRPDGLVSHGFQSSPA